MSRLNHKYFSRLIVLIACCAGCPVSGQQNNSAGTSNGEQSAEVGAHRSNNSQRQSKMETDFQTAREAFRHYSAIKLSSDPQSLNVTPIDSLVVELLDNGRIGRLWSFGSTTKGSDAQVRGWAAADGTVVTIDHNIDAFLEEVGIWSGRADLDAYEIVDKLIWTLFRHKRVGPAELTIEPGGEGRLTFLTRYLASPDGHYPTPDNYYQYTITFKSDHTASVTRENAAPSL